MPDIASDHCGLWFRYSKQEGEHDMSQYTHLVTEKATVAGFTPVIKIMGTDMGAMMRCVDHVRCPPGCLVFTESYTKTITSSSFIPKS